MKALKNPVQDTKHEKAGYYYLTFETLRGKVDQPNDQFCNFLLPLLGDKDQEKVLEVVTKVEKNNHQKFMRQNPGPGRNRGYFMVGECGRFFFTSCERRERTSECSERVSSATPRNE